MKSLLVILLIGLATTGITAQDFQELYDYEFEDEASYKSAEPLVIDAANYLFKHPAKDDEFNRLISLQFILAWMEGTPVYTFTLGDEMLDLTKGSDDLFGLYLAGISKLSLENKTEMDDTELYEATEKLLVDYCADKSNKIKPSKKIKNILKEQQ